MYLMLLPLLLLLAWYCYSSCYSLFNALDTVGPFATPCSSFVDVVAFLVALCLSLVDVVAPLAIPCSMLLFLLLFFVRHYCFSYCSLLDVFNIVAFCSTHLTLLFFLLAQVPFCYTMMLFLLLLLAQCYYSCFSCFKLILPPSVFCRCGRSCPNSSFEARPRRWDLFFQSLFDDELFYYPCCFGKFWLKMCFFVVCRNCLDIVHLILCIAFHFYTLHFICPIALCIFLAHIFKNFLSIACKCVC